MSGHTTAALDHPSGTTGLSDEAFVSVFESCTLAGDAFRHYDHIRLAWIYLGDLPLIEATERMVASIRRFALYHGAATKYHDTMTRLWMRLVAHARAASGFQTDFTAFAAANPVLFDKRFVFRFYSEARLFSDAARSGWVEPDLLPLPDGPAHAFQATTP